jgi:hypothetical protein
MLIPKGKFLNLNLLDGMRAVLLIMMLSWLGRAPLQAAPPAPHVVAVDFYGWYMATLSADQDPLSDRHATFNNYVARDLVTRLVERLRSGILPDSDYFLQSDGYQSAWRRQVAATTVSQRGSAADVIVTLGAEDGPRRVLALVMVLEGGTWKIRQVALGEARPSKSSFDQSVI